MKSVKKISFLSFALLSALTLAVCIINIIFLSYLLSFLLLVVFLVIIARSRNYYKSNQAQASVTLLVFGCIMLTHIIFIIYASFANITSYIFFLIHEVIYFAVLFFITQQTEASIRKALMILAAKACLLGLLPLGTLIPKGPEKIIPYHAFDIFPPLLGLPVLLVAFVEIMTVGIYLYKMHDDPAGWRRPPY